MNTTKQALSAPFSAPTRTGAKSPLRRLLLGSVAMGGGAASLLMAGAAMANPTGGTVAAGGVTINSSKPGTLNVTQSTSSAIINWQSFSIGADETTNFLLPNASSVTLNRVTGNDPSAIFGHLTSNGTVFLVNPNGVFFGAHSKVDVAGIVATTANITDENFLTGNYAFNTPSLNPNASVVNEGEISIADRGLAALVAPSVRNSGVIQAKLGRVALGGANSFTLDFWGDGLLSFGAGSTVTTAPKQADGSPVKALVTNSGKIVADGGTVELTARTVKSVVDQSINTDGIIEAKSIGTHNGNIVLGGGDAGTVEVAGSLDASGTNAGSTGGTIQVAGASVDLASTATLNTSGAAGGGKILIGTDGKKNAATTKVAKGATITASALTKGTGGAVTVMSDQSTDFGGAILSRGGAQGGDGGAVEISGHDKFSLTGTVDLTAAKGSAGSLFIDPSTLEITGGTAGSGTQDSAASGGTLASTAPDVGGNTISQGTLQSLSATTNISLQATGQITVDAMTGGVLNLATNAGHSFTLTSTTTGGISFVDPTTEIKTAGGSISLLAQGDGALTNIGKLTSNGGAIALQSTRNIQLAGAVNAGAGAVSIKTNAGSISGGGQVTGSTVALNAIDGSIGDATTAVSVNTTGLALSTGGSIYLNDATTLASLAITSIHAVAPSSVFHIAALNQTFTISDSNSVYNLANIQSATPLNFSFTGDNTLSVGTINVGTGALALTSTAGNIVSGGPTSLLTAGSVSLSATNISGAVGSIGGNAPINTATGTINVVAGTGGANVSNTGGAILSLATTGAAKVAATGNLTAAAVSATSVALASTAGKILDDANSATAISTGSLTLQAATGIGTTGARVTTNATSVSASTTTGDADLNLTNSASVNLLLGNVGGTIDLQGAAASGLTLTSVTAGGLTAVNTGGSINPYTVIVASGGTVTLTATGTSSSIMPSSTGSITASTIALTAGGSIGSLNLAAPTGGALSLSLNAGGQIAVNASGTSVTLAQVQSAFSLPSYYGLQAISIIATAGDLNLETISATGGVVLAANAGNIFGTGATVTGGTVSLTSSTGVIGTSGNRIGVATPSLTLSSHGDIYVDDTLTLTTLSLADYHTGTTPNTLSLTAPFLTFQVTDSGTAMTLGNITAANLTSGFSFATDETLVVGQVRLPGSSVQLRTTGSVSQPAILDDGNSSSRITAGSVTLYSAGGIGTSAAPVQIDTTYAYVSTTQNLYLQSIQDLSTLYISSTHADPTQNYTFQVTAPSLNFNVTDNSATGYALTNISDITGLSFGFSGDRNLVVGTIDVSPIGIYTTNTGKNYQTSGSVSLQGPSLVDDGSASTFITAASVALGATTSTTGAIGSAAHPIGVVTESLSGSSPSDFYVEAPTIANTTQHAIVLNNITAGGALNVKVDDGDIQLGKLNGAAVTVTASEGQISAYYGYNSVFVVDDISAVTGTTSVTLNASGDIGSHAAVINLTTPSITATVGGGLYLAETGSATLAASTGGPIEYTGTGAATLGVVSASISSPVTIAATQILAGAGESLTGSAITLNASSSSIGSVGTPLSVTTPSLTATTAGDLYVTDTTALSTLAITTSSGAVAVAAPGQTFAITKDGSNYLLQDIESTTPLAFSFTGSPTIEVGTITLPGGSVSLTSGGAIIDDGNVATLIDAPTVSLAAAGTIGSTDTTTTPATVTPISLTGTTSLKLQAGGSIYVADDTNLASLAITQTSGSQTAAVFGITAGTDTITITDDGTTAYQDYLQSVSGSGLTDFAFTSVKNVEVGTILASGSVALTSAGGSHGNVISKDGVGTGITTGTASLTVSNGSATGAAIGTTGNAVAIAAGVLKLNSTGNIYVADSTTLTELDLAVTHANSTNYTYSIAGQGQTFTFAEGGTETIGVSSAAHPLTFTLTTDRSLAIGTVNASSTGAVSLTSTGGSLSSSSSLITAGSVTLSATAGNQSVGAGGAISVATPQLSISSGANIAVNDSVTLTDLTLNVSHPTYTNSGNESWSYSLGLASGQTFNVSDPYQATDGTVFINNPTTLISSVTSTTALNFSLASDRDIEVKTISVGAGNVALTATAKGIYNDLDTSTKITANSLTLNAAFAGQKTLINDNNQHRELDTSVNSLSSDITGYGPTVTTEGGLFVINTGSLTLGSVVSATTADITLTTGSFTQGTGAHAGVSATNVVLSAVQGAIGTSVNPVATTARYLSLTSGEGIFVTDSVGLDSLAITATHFGGSANSYQVTDAASSLALSLTDDGATFTLAGLSDRGGIDFSFSGDETVYVGTLTSGANRGLSITSTGDILTAGSTSLTGETVSLTSTGGSVGATGSGNAINTTTTNLSVLTDANVYVANSLELGGLSFNSNQGSGAATYVLTAPDLTFNVTTAGTSTTLSDITDTGAASLSLAINTTKDLVVRHIDTTSSGRVALTSAGAILAYDSSNSIVAANVSFDNIGSSVDDAIGNTSTSLNVTAPVLTVAARAGVNINDTTHIDSLTFEGYAINSDATVATGWISITGPNGQNFTVDHDATGYTNASADDATAPNATGMALSLYVPAQSISLGSINLGTTAAPTGSFSLDDEGGSITQATGSGITGANVNLTASGAVGTVGSPIDVFSSTYGAVARSGGIYTSLLSPSTTLTGLYASGGPIGLTVTGDIALGTIYFSSSNSFSISVLHSDDTRGSILSGTIANASSIDLSAEGDIGTNSAVVIANNSQGTTTTVTNATAGGLVAITDADRLNVDNVSAHGSVSLTGGYDLAVGTIASDGHAVTLTAGTNTASNSRSISSIGSGVISGSSVTMTTGSYGVGSIGSSGSIIHVDTPVLSVSNPQDVYVTDASNLTSLTINRAPNSSSNAVSGTLSIASTAMGTPLIFSATDNGSVLALNTITDSSALNLTVSANDTIQVGTINVGGGSNGGTVSLTTRGTASILAANGSSTITANSAALTASGTGSAIGSSGTSLGLAVDTLTASSGTGGVYLTQAGSLTLTNVTTTGDLHVTASSGDLTLGTLSYGSGSHTLNLTATTGSILNGNPTGTTINGGNGAITLSAANGIGSALTPLTLNATGAVNVNTTGTGSIYLSSAAGLTGGLTIVAHNGAINLVVGGSSTLTTLTSSTDAVGNDINVTATSGNLTVGSVTAGTAFSTTHLTATAGSILGSNGSNLISGDAVYLVAGGSIGSSGTALNLFTPQIFATTTNTIGSGNLIKLATTGQTVLSDLQSNGANITVSDAGELFAALVASSGGTIALTTTGSNNDLIAGTITAGSGSVGLTSAGALYDDGVSSSRISGTSVSLTAANAIGTSNDAVGTTTSILSASETSNSGTGIYIADGTTTGLTLASIVAHGGDITLNTAGATTATTVTDLANNHTVSITNSTGDLTVNSVSASTTGGAVVLDAVAGSILAGSGGTNLTAHDASLTAANAIGSLTSFATGAGVPLHLAVTTLDLLKTTAAGSVISVSQTGALTLASNVLSIPTDGSAYIQATGNIDASAGLTLGGGANLALVSGGILTVPTAAISTTGQLVLSGTTDVVSAGNSRTITEDAATLKFRSGNAGGNIVLDTAAGAIDAALTGTGNLTVDNTGIVSALTLATSNGNVTFTNDTDATATLVTSGGTGKTITLTSTAGTLTVGTVNAGSTGTIDLNATAGSITGTSNLTAATLNMVAGTSIGTDAAHPFTVDVTGFSAQVTGTGGIYVADTGAVTLGTISTNNGDIVITSAGTMSTPNTITAGSGGNITLTSTGGNVNLDGTVTTTGTDPARGNLTVTGNTITLNTVDTVGTQHYVGNTTIGGDLTGSGITVTGNATLSGGDRTLDTSAADGAITVTGMLNGGGHGLVLTAGTGAIALDGGASDLTTVTASGGNLFLSGVTTSGAQNYTGAATLLGGFTITGTGGFDMAGPVMLDGTTIVTTHNGAVSFDGTIDGAQVLVVSSEAGNATFGGAIGGGTRLGALTVDSSGATSFGGGVTAASVTTDAGGTLAINGGLVDTTGSQSYGETATTLGADTVLNATTASFAGTIDGAHALTVNGGASFGGAVGQDTALTLVSVSGPVAINGGAVTTTGAQSYGSTAIGTDTVLTATGVTFAGTVDATSAGGQGLTVDGNAAFDGAVGGHTALKSIAVSGSAVIDADMTSVGGQTYTGAVTLGGPVVLATVNAPVLFGATVDGDQALTIDSGSGNATFIGAIGGTTRLGDLIIDSSGATRFGGSVTAASVTTGAGGTLAIDGGLVDTTGSQSYGEAATTLGADTVLNATTASFAGTIDGAHALTVNGGAGFGGAIGQGTALTAVSVSDPVAINGGSVTTTGAQSYGSATIGTDTVLTATGVTFAGTVDAASAGGQGLIVDGNAAFDGVVGGTAALKSVFVSGSSVIDDNVTSIGAQTYEGAVLLASDPVLTTTNAAVTFGSTLDGSELLTINSGSGAVTFVGAVGGTTRLGDLTVNSSGATTFGGSVKAASVTTDAAGTLAINGGAVDTTGAQSYGEDTLVLGADTVLTATGVTFAGMVDAAGTGSEGLTINGNAVFGGAVGGNAALKSVSVSGSSVIDLSVTTTGGQTYDGAVTLGGDAVLTTTNAPVLFGSTVDGSRALTVRSGNGDVTFVGAIGGTALVGSLTVDSQGATSFDGSINATSVTTDAGGTLALNGKSVSTAFDQNYGEAVTLGTDTVLNSTVGAVTFGSTIDGAHALEISAANGVTVAGAVGGTTRLGALTVDTGAATSFGGSVKAASVTTDAGGTLAINGGSVDTTGAQSFGEAVTLGADTVLTGTTIGFAGTLDGTHALIIDGNTTFNATVGGTAALANLSIIGTATIDTSIATVGNQAYASAVTLGTDATLTTHNGSVLFQGPVDGSHNLTITSGTGAVAFASTVGATTRLGALTVNSGGATTFDAAVKAASVTTDAAGTLVLAGGLVDTTGAQSYGEAATLGTDMVLNATNVSFGGTVDGAQALTVNGNSSFAGVVGGKTALTSVAVNGAAALNGGSVTTTGTQSYGNGSTLGTDTVLNATNASFSGAFDGAHALTVNGTAAFNGTVGADTALTAVLVTGTTSLNGASIVTSGGQTYGAAVLVGSGSSLTSQNGSIGFASTIDSANRADLTLSAINGTITVKGAIGATGPLGALSVANVQNATFSGAVDASSLAVTSTGTATFQDAIVTDGTGGITLSGNSYTLLTPVTATAGGLTINLNSGGSLVIGATATINTATGIVETQTGPTTITIATDLTNKKGAISFAGDPTLIGSKLTFQTDGAIKFAGLNGSATDLTLIAGQQGTIAIGQPRTLDPTKLAILKSLTVPLIGGAASATLYGTLKTDTGVLPSSEVNSDLHGGAYTYNDYPWGPLNLIGTITVTVPTTNPVATTNTGLGPNLLDAGQAPSLLTFAGNNGLLGVGQSQDLLNTTTNGNGQQAVSGTSEPLEPGEKPAN